MVEGVGGEPWGSPGVPWSDRSCRLAGASKCCKRSQHLLSICHCIELLVFRVFFVCLVLATFLHRSNLSAESR